MCIRDRNWTQRATQQSWKSVASSQDGSKLIAAADNSTYLYLSTDSGQNWTQSAFVDSWIKVSSSGDGTKLAAASFASGRIYLSSDSGANWATINLPVSATVSHVLLSPDGSRVYVVLGGNPLLVSHDWGMTWAKHGSPISGSGYLACSTDGSYCTLANGELRTASVLGLALSLIHI